MALGGPGVVAHSYAREIAAALPVTLREVFDLVLFDQRGIGESCGYWCVESASEFYQVVRLINTSSNNGFRRKYVWKLKRVAKKLLLIALLLRSLARKNTERMELASASSVLKNLLLNNV